jgi:hypothetical protein
VSASHCLCPLPHTAQGRPTGMRRDEALPGASGVTKSIMFSCCSAAWGAHIELLWPGWTHDNVAHMGLRRPYGLPRVRLWSGVH